MVVMEAGVGLVLIGVALAIASFILLALGASAAAPYAFYCGVGLSASGWCVISWYRHSKQSGEAQD